jgi:hypothetical protein
LPPEQSSPDRRRDRASWALSYALTP